MGNFKESSNPNTQLIKQLSELRGLNKRLDQPFKVNAYTKAINGIKKIKESITLNNAKKLKEYKIVGDRIYKKVLEFLTTGKISEVSKLKEKNKGTLELMGVRGIGPKFVQDLNARGIHNLRDLKSQGVHLLNTQQQLGLKYYSDLNTPIPRLHITTFVDGFKQFIKNFAMVTVTGSYRRLKPFSNDIDILVILKVPFDAFIQKLKTLPGFVEFLNVGQSKVSFITRIKGHVRQVDLVMVPRVSYYSALVYFTGSKSFNERLRSRAKQLGYTLNEWGITNNLTGRVSHPSSENDLFKFLGFPWLEPKDRE
jgi:DNA polymerase (family 10)